MQSEDWVKAFLLTRQKIKTNNYTHKIKNNFVCRQYQGSCHFFNVHLVFVLKLYWNKKVGFSTVIHANLPKAKQSSTDWKPLQLEYTRKEKKKQTGYCELLTRKACHRAGCSYSNDNRHKNRYTLSTKIGTQSASFPINLTEVLLTRNVIQFFVT